MDIRKEHEAEGVTEYEIYRRYLLQQDENKQPVPDPISLLNEFYPFVFDDNKPFLVKRAYRFFVCFLAHPEQAVDNFRRAFIGYGNKSARCF